MKTWFSIKAAAQPEAPVEVTIFDEIGVYGVSAKEFISELQAKCGGAKKDAKVSINSYGGSVFDAIAMYNALRTICNSVTVRVLGVAASAASLIAMAGDKIEMPENSYMMIHNPWAFAAGNADELRDFADTLDTIGEALVKTYVARTGLPESEVRDMLASETWLSAEDAVAKGFATEIVPALKVAASYDVSRFPDNVRAIFDSAATDAQDATVVVETNTTTTTWVTDDEGEDDPAAGGGATDPAQPNDPAAHAALADEIRAYAESSGVAQFALVVALDPASTNIQAAKARLDTAREIFALCSLAGKPEMASALVKDNKDVAYARTAIFDALASAGDSLITSSIPSAKTVQTTTAGVSVWAKLLKPAEQK